MPHFASVDWPASYGPVARLNATVTAAALGAVGASPVSGSTEGTDLLTYTVPAAASGLYQVSSHIHMDVVSNAGTSQTIETNVTYNDGAAVTKQALGSAGGGGSATITPVSTLTVDFHIGQSGVIRAEAGTDITVHTEAINGGTVATTGSLDLDITISRIG